MSEKPVKLAECRDLSHMTHEERVEYFIQHGVEHRTSEGYRNKTLLYVWEDGIKIAFQPKISKVK